MLQLTNVKLLIWFMLSVAGLRRLREATAMLVAGVLRLREAAIMLVIQMDPLFRLSVVGVWMLPVP